MTTYCWREGNNPDGEWQIGRIARPFVSNNIDGWIPLVLMLSNALDEFRCHIVQHYHTGELELVPADWLQPYPTEPIQDPTK